MEIHTIHINKICGIITSGLIDFLSKLKIHWALLQIRQLGEGQKHHQNTRESWRKSERSQEQIWYLWHIKMEMRLCTVHHINSPLGSVKAMDAITLLCPHRMTSLMRWRPACQYNQIVQSPTSWNPVWSSAECVLFSSSIPSLTLSPHTLAPSSLDPYFISAGWFFSSFTFSDCWVYQSGSWLFSACCPVYEAPPSETWRLPLPPWAQPASWSAGLGTLLRKYTEKHAQLLF